MNKSSLFRQDPSAPEPFQALANLYEENDDIEKSLQFALLAAQLAPPDPDEWSRLADMSLEQGDIKQERFGLSIFNTSIFETPAVFSRIDLGHFTFPHGWNLGCLCMILKVGNPSQACFCYKKAIEADPCNAKLYFTRC